MNKQDNLKSLVSEAQKEANALVKEAQERIKAQLFAPNWRDLADRLGISPYKFKQALESPTPDLDVLESIDKLLKRVDKVQNTRHTSKKQAA